MDAAQYDVLSNDRYGRYLVAKKDLNGGELIFTDLPFAVGPKPGKLIFIEWNVKYIYCYIKTDTFVCTKISKITNYVLINPTRYK